MASDHLELTELTYDPLVLHPPNVLSLSRHVPSRASQTDTRIYEARGAEAPGQRTAASRLLRRVSWGGCSETGLFWKTPPRGRRWDAGRRLPNPRGRGRGAW